MISYINQYKLLFFFSWVTLYLIFPSWALPISVTARAFVFFGLMIYFCISALLMNRWFNELAVDKPVFVRITEWWKHVKSNLWLVIVCFLAIILHIYPIFSPILIIGDEALHIQGGLWIYEYIDSSWHSRFQIMFWVIIGLIILARNKNLRDKFRLNSLKNGFQWSSENNLLKYFFIFLIFCCFVAYFLLLKNITYFSVSIRYPPVAKFIYFITYSAFGITHIGPRILQLIFYVLSAFYLYRTINLFDNKELALIGASIYLFLPVTFTYAGLAELACGTYFFVILISFYFLRFIKDNDDRDLLLFSYFIGIGFLYKRVIFLMLFVCLAFLIFDKIKKRDFSSTLHVKTLLLSLVPIVPWMILGKFFSWRNYAFQQSHFTSLEKIAEYFLVLQSNIPSVIFFLFLISIIFILVAKRNILTVFFGFLFIMFYLFHTSDISSVSPRFSMVFYFTIAVYLSQFISIIATKIRWKYFLKLVISILCVYLIVICSVTPLRGEFLKNIEFRKLQHYPSDEAMRWVKDNVGDGEKIVTLRIMTTSFYREKYKIDRNRIINFWYEFEEVSSPEKLRIFYESNNVSYIMFPYSPTYITNFVYFAIFQYLKDNTHKEFEEVARFNLNENYIYIYRIEG